MASIEINSEKRVKKTKQQERESFEKYLAKSLLVTYCV